MFGPAILVNPVLKAKTTKRSVYLRSHCVVRLLDRQILKAAKNRSGCALERMRSSCARVLSFPWVRNRVRRAGSRRPIELRIYRAQMANSIFMKIGRRLRVRERRARCDSHSLDDVTGMLTIGARKDLFRARRASQILVVLVATARRRR